MSRSRGALVLLVCLAAAAYAAQVGYAQTAAPLSPAQVAMACAPALTLPQPPPTPLRITGAQDTVPRSLYGVGELIIVNGGTGTGVQVNQEYFIRRHHVFGGGSRAWQTIHTVGWLRIVSVNDTTAIGRIETVCDGVMAGDYLEPFVVPPAIVEGGPLAFADLDFSALARVMFGVEEKMMGAPGDFMVVASRDATLAPGARVAVYRDLHSPGVPLTAIGEGVIVSMKDGTPVMRITSARDAVRSGDYVVARK